MVREAVASVLEQTYRPIEIILVNDGSTDGSAIVLEHLVREHPDIIRVIHQHNQGPGPARETGRLAAGGEYIQYLDSDDWLLPRKFSVQVAALKKNPDCGIAYGISRLVDADGHTLQEPSKWTGRKLDYLFPALLVDRWWHTHTPLFRSTVTDAAGSWPGRRPEDWDLEARMGADRVRLVFCDEVVSCQREYPDANRVSRGARDAYLRDEAWFLPRLYQCAVQAGVSLNAPEMHHFSRWAFMRARHLGLLGEEKLACRLGRLAQQSNPARFSSINFFVLAARFVGWKMIGRIGYIREKFF